ncbi:MAG TPA: DUF2716 domain-containing protein [Steroidobacteraceae bacterium]|nr:DUF2716 domain-containing protein [Steroidobacteraceae bacterium]
MRSLGEPEYTQIWDAFYARFHFKPGTHGPFPAITEPPGSITFSLLPDSTDADIDEFIAAMQSALKAATTPGHEIYYLDWQHECFAFDPHAEPNPRFNGYPDGDYAILLARDLSYGSFGHPWEDTICCFGDPFVREILRAPPRVFHEIKRRN